MGGANSKFVQDHKGVVYPFLSDMLEYYDLPYQTFSKRVKSDWTLEDTLELPRDYSTYLATCIDSKGTCYASVNEMAEAHGLSFSDLMERLLTDGLSLREALNLSTDFDDFIPVVESEDVTIDKDVPMLCYRLVEWTEEERRTDHKGIVYDSIDDMLKQYGLPATVYWFKLASGWCLKDILETSAKRCGAVVDHLGNKFKSTYKMAEYWNIPYTTLKKRFEAEWSLKEALEIPLRTHNSFDRRVSDHKGNVFECAADLAYYYNIPMDVFKKRVKVGWLVKDILETPVEESK